jgi:cytochrome c-type protein NapB
MSLRGAEINASDPEGDGTRYGRDQPPLPRDFVQQPPLIPAHDQGLYGHQELQQVPGLPRLGACQGDRRHQDLGDPLQDRDGEELSSVSPRRYFCNQCHVPQSDAKPLVGNTFKPGTGMR